MLIDCNKFIIGYCACITKMRSQSDMRDVATKIWDDSNRYRKMQLALIGYIQLNHNRPFGAGVGVVVGHVEYAIVEKLEPIGWWKGTHIPTPMVGSWCKLEIETSKKAANRAGKVGQGW